MSAGAGAATRRAWLAGLAALAAPAPVRRRGRRRLAAPDPARVARVARWAG